MKTTLHKLGMLMAVLLATLSASAYDFEVDGIYYNVVSLSDLTCEVVGCGLDGDIVIPSEVTYNNRTLSVISIGKEYWTGIGYSRVSNISIPNSVTSIEEGAFKGCEDLRSVKILDAHTSIGNRSFMGCRYLENIDLGINVTSIGDEAFSKCESLFDIIIPNSVSRIGSEAFYYCISLSGSLLIPNSVISIGDSAFEDCTSLAEVSIGNSVSSIGNKTFKGCSALSNIDFGESVTSIGYDAFEFCGSLRSVTIPNTVTDIGAYAFSCCRGLENIELSQSLIEIKSGLFQECGNLKSLTIPGSVTFVDWGSYDVDFGLPLRSCDSLKQLQFLYGTSKLTVANLYTCNSYMHHDVLNLEDLYIDRDLEWSYLTKSALEHVKNLTLGSHISNCSLPSSYCENIEIITSYSVIPPMMEEFSNAAYINCIVKVPYEALEAYQQAEVWKNFWNLEGFDPNGTETDVEEIKHDAHKTEIGRYDLNGRRVSEDHDGISIIKYSDGSAKKQFIHKN